MQLAYIGGGQSLLFSGLFEFQDTWLWHGQTGTWEQLSPAVQPPARGSGALVWDPGRRRAILFGGVANGSILNDVWEWNPDANTWSLIEPAGERPAPVELHGMAFDSRRGRAVVYGGTTGAAVVWEWDGVSWTKIVAPGSPPAGDSLAMTYDPTRERVLLYGGSGASDHAVWEWDGTSWSRLAAGDSGPPLEWTRIAPTGRGTLLAFGGFSSGAAGRTASLQETWEWSYVTSSWSKLTPTSQPGAREGHGMVYDDARNRIVLFGGGYGDYVVSFLSDTWEYSPSATR